MDTNELLEPFARMLETAMPPAAVRAVEAGGSAEAMWQEIAASGFLDALVDEAAGVAGLSLAEVCPLIMALGAHAVPLPVADTMVARALLAKAGHAAPDGPIVLASGLAQPVPGALVANHVLVDTGEALVLAEIAAFSPAPTGAHHDLAARLSAPGSGPTGNSIHLPRPAHGLRPLAAAMRAALIAGAAARVADMTTAYANERVQFGKPIGRQQALQQLLAVMAEDMIACRIAAQLGLSGGLDVPPALAATAKATTSAAAARIAATAHAAHGAIGISEEYDLQLFTRRLHAWRLADGSEGYWAAQLGTARLGSEQGCVDWVRAQVFA